MPINVYCGLMGSGKSYESVSNVIIPAVLAGRDVVTNVDGIDGDAIAAYCVEKKGASFEQLGQVRHCQNADVSKDDFFPYGEDVDTFCRPGDLVVIDEAWKFWGTKSKVCHNHAVFFREHRHYVSEKTSVACDLVLMVQDIGDLNRILKVVVEATFKTTKLKSLGLSSKYRVDMYESYRLTKSFHVTSFYRHYDKEIFPLYSSYQGGKGKEVQVDKRQNIWNNKMVYVFIVGILVFGSYSGYNMYKFFTGPSVKKDKAQAQAVTPDATANASGKAHSSDSQTFSDTWRYVGTYLDKNGANMAVVADSQGRVRMESPSVFSSNDATAIGTVDGRKVTMWTGALTGEKK
ncbi:membrane protein [Undibacterium sp. YM2]|uniref:zonular occludens toxin family protein n=1 Tax=Undibacterium sp. YM2 TaxID=2058625 RepID=UPI001331F7E6|nr:zonular occludens toxin domain-containing protein [Undibacterium sp. YM2]BBB66828.1 membrane protein [Undibacterium sp. YM2]